MKKNLTYAIAFLGLAILFNACKQERKVQLTEPDQNMLDSLSMQAMVANGDTIKQSNVIRPAAKGLEWKAWENWFKSCPQNQTFKNNIVYLGTASTKDLGYILSKDVSIDKWDFFKISTDPAVNNSFIDTGRSVEACNMTTMKDFSIDMLFGGKLFSSVNASLSGLLSNAKSITLKSGTWRVESIDAGPFMNFINNSKDATIGQYRDALLDKKNIVLTKVLKVSGFELEIVAKDSLAAGLNATLQNGFNVNVVAPDSTHKIGFSLNFKKGAKNTINVSSKGEFSLFAQASKGKELQ